MSPQAPSTTGLARPTAPTGAPAVSPSGAPGVPPAPSGVNAPAVATQAPTNFNTSAALNAVANYYQIPRQTAQAQANVEGNKFNATTAYEGGLQAQSAFAKEHLDASAYKIMNTKTGIQILDPVTGQPVDTNTYVNRTGSEGFNNLMGALQKSNNPQDQRFVNDYNNFQQYMNASLTAKYDKQGNPTNEQAKLVESYQQANPQLAKLNPQQAAELFNSQYGNYLGVGQAGPSPQESQYTPAVSQQLQNYLLEHNLLYGQTPQNAPPGLAGLFDFNLPAGSTSQSVSSLAPPGLK